MIDIKRLRVRAGLEPDDDSKDEQLTAAYAQAVAIAEVYLDRQLARGAVVEQFAPGEPVIILRAWPVASITTISTSLGAVDANLYWSTLPWGRLITRNGGAWGASPITVSYVGGFVDLPAPLEWAILQIFDTLWATDPEYGGTVGGGSSGPDIQKITVNGVGSLDYGSTSTSGSAAGGQADPWGMISADVADVLLRYANNAVVGVG